jgi:hypothetical protein
VAVMYRPRKARVVCWILAVLVFVVALWMATGLDGPTGGGPGYFQRGDQVAMVGLGVFGALGVLLFTRPRVIADEQGVRVRNIVSSYELPWSLVRAVTFGRGASWLTLDLRDDDVVAVMAVQMADKEYAVAAARRLRELHAAATAVPADGSSA